ncbi:Peptidase family M23 [Streptomyces radiopugnans]|uniref:Peptidase family M23 n=2 Tax=Streptomyces radiopugnans TaxID=403935 RepID=A0A1H9HGZ4_9ACTN|nr:Peptidase family M23 [Streptomyces radiopugnans]
MGAPFNRPVTDHKGKPMQRRSRRILAAASAVAALAATAPAAVATPQETSPDAVQTLSRPNFKMPFACGQVWRGSNWNGHSPAHSVDWNHYDANGNPDDFKRRVFASAGGTVLSSHYSTTTGYGNTIVIGHGDGWRTRYAHLYNREVSKGDKVSAGQLIGRVGKSSATYSLSPHLHYEQIHNGAVVTAVVQGVGYPDYTTRYQTSNNRC